MHLTFRIQSANNQTAIALIESQLNSALTSTTCTATPCLGQISGQPSIVVATNTSKLSGGAVAAVVIIVLALAAILGLLIWRSQKVYIRIKDSTEQDLTLLQQKKINYSLISHHMQVSFKQ